MKAMSNTLTRKLIIPVVLIILRILTVNDLYCQPRENMIDFLSGRFKNYVEAVPWEEIYLHTDREGYIAGEYIRTNIYLFERESLKPSVRSKIAYVEILNSENRPVVQKRFLLTNGCGPGQLQLPDTLSTGNYTLRAYTNWMKNFLPYNCFVKDIRVYNALKRNNYMQTAGPGMSEAEENKTPDKTGISIGQISRHPEKGDLEIVIHSDENYTLLNGNLFYLFIQTHGRIDQVSSERFTGNKARIIVPGNTLAPGINQITVFNLKGQPVCIKYNYTSSPEPGSASVTISSSESYGTREKILLDISMEKAVSVTHNAANLSIAIVPGSGNPSDISISKYLLFGTEFGFFKTGTVVIDDLSSEQIDSILQNIRSNWIKWDEVLSGRVPHFKYQAETEEHFLSGKISNVDQAVSPASETVILSMPGRQPEFQSARTDEEGNFSFRINIDEDVKDLVIMSDDAGKEKKIILESSFSDKYLKTGMPAGSDMKSFPGFIEEMSVNYQARKIYGITDAGKPLQSKISPLRPARFYGEPDIELILADYVSLPKMEEIFFELLPRVSLKKRNSVYEILITDRIYETRYEVSPDLFLDGVKIKDAAIIASLDPEDVEKIDVVRDIYAIGSYFFPGILNVVTKHADFRSIPLPDYMIRLPYRVIDPVLSFAMPDYSSEDRRNSSIPDFRNTLYWDPCLKPDKEGKIRIEFWTSDITGDYEINLR